MVRFFRFLASANETADESMSRPGRILIGEAYEQSTPHREMAEQSFGDSAIDWQAATPSWGALFFGIVLPVMGVLVALAAIAVALYPT